jgi:hypothetical protein
MLEKQGFYQMQSAENKDTALRSLYENDQLCQKCGDFGESGESISIDET